MMEDGLSFHYPNLPILSIFGTFYAKMCLFLHFIFYSISSHPMRCSGECFTVCQIRFVVFTNQQKIYLGFIFIHTVFYFSTLLLLKLFICYRPLFFIAKLKLSFFINVFSPIQFSPYTHQNYQFVSQDVR